MNMLFADDAPSISDPSDTPSKKPWCVLLVDDDEQVHAVTRLALKGFEFQDSGLELLSAY